MESSVSSEKETSVKIFKKHKELLSTLPRENGWKFPQPLFLYQGFWCFLGVLEGVLFAQEKFRAKPSDIFLCSVPKTGTTWLKALSFATVTRTRFNISDNPLFSNGPHDCIPFLDLQFLHDPTDHQPEPAAEDLPLWSTHLPYSSLPKSIMDSGCKIVYICRNPKDALVSVWHYRNKIGQAENIEYLSLAEAFELFCKGLYPYGPYWDHVLGYWKASREFPGRVLFLKYEELIRDTGFHLKRLAEFMGCHFSIEEEEEGAVQKIVEFCSFDNLSNLEVNKTGDLKLFRRKETKQETKNSIFFRKGIVGDWRNYLTNEMAEKLDNIIESKLSGSGFTFMS